MLEKLMQTGKLDRRLAYFLDLDNDNEMTREFSMKKVKNKLDLLQPFPDFGFNNDLHFVEQEEVGNFWKILGDFIFKKKPKFERLKNFVAF
jgi:hypothetical protein